MNYQNTKTKEIKDHDELKPLFNNSVIPVDGTQKIGVWRLVVETDKPVYDKYTHEVVEVEPVNYTQTWKILKLSTDKINMNIVEFQERLIINIIQIAKKMIEEKTSKYSTGEMVGWSDLHKEALDYQTGVDISKCGMIKDESDLSGDSYSETAERIVQNAIALKKFRSYIAGTRSRKKKEIKALKSIKACREYDLTKW